MLSKDVKEIIQTQATWLAVFEEYDRTGVWPLERRRIDLTLSNRTIERLRERARAEGKPISRIVDELVASA